MHLCQRLCQSRKVLYIVFTLVFLWLSVKLELVLLKRVTKTRLFFHKGYVLETPGCRLPDYDPFHWTVRAHYRNQSGGEDLCDESGYLITFADRTTPVLNERVLASRYNATVADVTCFYAEILRNTSSPVPDNTTVVGHWRTVEFGRPLRGSEYILLRCDRAGAGTIFSRHSLLARKKRRPQVLDEGARRERLNVLVLGVDSVSRLATLRHMPLTRRYLARELNAFEFVGYSKVGLASFQNQLPLLTGLSSDAIDRLFGKMHYDVLPHLMSVYRKRGFRTLFLEEYPDYGLFTYHAPFGFKKVPTDYYPRAIMKQFTRPTCSVLRYVQDLSSLDGQLLFAYVWLAELMHGDFNGAGRLDLPLESLLRNLSSSGVLRRTALLVISDHGLRFGETRRTEIGRVEDFTPSFFLALPEHFLRQHPEAAVHLQVNQRRLITAYDVHATLLTLAELPRFEPMVTDSGISLFRGISPHRTCAEAAVPADFCACADSHSAPAQPEDVSRLVEATVAYINGVVNSSFPGKCVKWRLSSVEEAKLTTVNSTEGGQEVRFSVTFHTEPNAYFDVHGWIANATSAWDLHVDDLDRLDEYSYQAKCVPSQHTARKMCRCKDYNDDDPSSWWDFFF
ncbi:uncharacterized protein [Dermacentor andersoni]|uniref:uncharacterized protein n=1 Tax=Dermacentor andersoni TaxID=34620 RepID=UPI003B3BE9C0